MSGMEFAVIAAAVLIVGCVFLWCGGVFDRHQFTDQPDEEI